MSQTFKSLGQRTTEPTKELETFLTPKYVTVVVLEALELTSICPVTNQPDFSTVVIAYRPDVVCLETKSLKLYLWSFRNTHIFGEGLASEIAEDIFNVLQPNWLDVEIRQGVRGGIRLTAKARLEKP